MGSVGGNAAAWGLGPGRARCCLRGPLGEVAWPGQPMLACMLEESAPFALLVPNAVGFSLQAQGLISQDHRNRNLKLELYSRQCPRHHVHKAA